ncbi:MULTISPECIES: class I adenylate-forming enzyme family protein [unclassified Paraburkholderia]|uniref:class I adenylate-forming enzyme family protein n=1 Tax=unclassified Paraburkholderia TaxID=2615204 RepID=UPI002AB31D23|nr:MULTISPECIES: class I adenylate-forming enzyme family protein [unclassified Paraburkholderia]
MTIPGGLPDLGFPGNLPPDADPRIWAQTLQHLVWHAVARDGRLRIADANGGAVTRNAVFGYVSALRAAGVQPGDVVVVKADNDARGAAMMLATWLNGCALCPVDPSAPADVHALITEQSGARAVFEAHGACTRVEHAAPHDTRLPIRRATGVDLALIIFTSGSSGRPKGVLLTHANVMSALRAIATYLGMHAQDRVLCVPPMFLDYGLYQVLFTLFVGNELVLATQRTNPLKVLGLIDTHRPTILPVVPALASGLSTVLNTFGQTLPSVRLVCNTGGHLAAATVDGIRRSFPNAEIYPMYGLTESKRALYLPPERVAIKPDSVGGPMPGLDARVVVLDEAGQRVEAQPGEVGELYLRGSSVMQGYHSGESTAGAKLVGGRYRDDVWLATGDLFMRDEDDCLFFVGRSKSLIKQRGYCIYPRDLEAAAESIADVGSAIAIGRREDDGDESAVLFVVLNRPGDTDAEERVRACLRSTLHRSLQARFVRFLPEWPALAVGKIDLGALARMAKEM